MKKVLITAGSGGIGFALVNLFAKNNYKVYFTYNLNEQIAADIQSLYNNVYAFKVDFKDKHNTDNFLNELRLQMIPDILINNFGVNNDCLFVNQSLDAFNQTMELNFHLPVKIIKFFLEDFISNRSGHIINISSIAANKPKLGNSAYGVSKIALERFSKTLALELARFNIKVNCIAPGFVDTDLLNRFLNNSNISKKEFIKNIPNRKLLSTDNIATIAYQIAENNIETTGSVFSIGGGENIF
jgi:NAD(P)-dependent dehydrogenase (short-subunit alcohol dehydrogenase family)